MTLANIITMRNVIVCGGIICGFSLLKLFCFLGSLVG